ncbi:circadian clock KaiB family protein [Pedobacter paludis]|uniref:Circadian clock protein KaiB n=1 Tax=Pedobacter paludis TaxID=2203212 RepID=A0A317EV84_9SPHI|nr:circadian clock KaiB family protein [Pedobacter paludis]PWS30385.1 circadian clock protein KaiB [Pedobacter paludis]
MSEEQENNRNVGDEEFYSLRLFIAGASPVSTRALVNIKAICDEYLKGRYELNVIDAHQQPLMVRDEDVTALPMLIKKSPSPKKKLIGDCSDKEKVLKGLGLRF